MTRSPALVVLCLALGVLPVPLDAQTPPRPEAHIGFRPGADSLLADWGQITGYLDALARASDHMRLDTIGRSTLGRPLLLVTLATPRNLARVDELKRAQALLADPRRMTAATADSLVSAQPAVVLINNNIHSTEIASSLMQLELVWRLTGDPAWRRMLDSLVVLVIPSTNPDGTDTVVSWYRQHRGTAYEAGPLPWLYHPYVGHDNNRDWYMLTQMETRAISRVLYEEWFPEVVWDVHQMGNRGARLFTPPFSDPVNPNLDPLVVEAINLAGTAMGTEVLDAGKTGVSHQDRFDLWWHGGFRSVPTRHNMVGILTEAASVRLASPIEQHPDSLRQPQRGVNYPAPWAGGWWRVGDIVEYELLAARGLLRLVANQRAGFVGRFVTLGRRAIAAGEAGNPAAFLIPPAQRDAGAVATLVDLLVRTGVEVRRASAPFTADGRGHAAGTLVIPMGQPFRAHVKDLLEPQRYPDRRAYAGGPLIPPYDVSGWSLGLQMGVTVETAVDPFEAQTEVVSAASVVPGTVRGTGPRLVLANRANAESGAVAEALRKGARVVVSGEPVPVEGAQLPPGTLVLEGDPTILAGIEARAVRDGFDAWRTSAPVPSSAGGRQGLRGIGLYKSWTASMDEGWARWVFERFGIPYESLTDASIRSGALRDVDVLVIPSLSDENIVSGRSLESVPREYSGGLGEDGVREITDFVARGGTLVALDASSDFAIRALKLPVRNVLQGAATGDRGSRFSAPGSIMGLVLEGGEVLTSGMPDSVAAFFDDGRAFAVTGIGARIVARYADEPMRSGFVQRPEAIAGWGAVADVAMGSGRVVLMGIRPQHRGQTHATFKLLFNAVLLGTGH